MANLRKVPVVLFALLGVCFLCGSSSGLAVMSIDFGSEWMKTAIVSPGVPMEIALNKESKRKTPSIISFRNGERTFGEDAQVVGTRFPQNSFSYILDLLGKSIDNPMVQLYQKRFPHYDIIPDKARNTVLFRIDGNTTYSPEELVAQILHKAKEFAESSAGQRINEAVITVPGFFNQIERRAMLQAADLAGIRVLQLINDYTAVALNYGVFNRKEINDSAHYILFYDMGASSTSATVVSFQNVKTKERGFVEIHPSINVLGVGYDRTLGGLEMQIRLQNYLAKEFDAMKKTPNSVFKNPRAMAKLFKEAGRVKNVLSANAEHYAQIEGLIDEKDFRLSVTREKFEKLCSDLFERVANPVDTAMETSGLTMDLISQVVLVGAGTRVPKVQEELSFYVNSELSKNINTDEAAALGAVYKAADLSKGFKVKKFVTRDSVLFPIQIQFDRIVDGKVKQIKRMLFGKMNTYPQKKIITFNKHYQDFEFYVNYAELEHLKQEEIDSLGSLNISKVSLSGVKEALEKHASEGAESKGIKAHFSMDESGILILVNVELVSEKSHAEEEEEEGTFSKLGSTISKLFAGSDDKENSEKIEEEKQKEDTKPVTEEPETPTTGKVAPEEEKRKSENVTKPSEEKETNKTDKAEKKPKIVTIKEHIDVLEKKIGSQPLNADSLDASLKKINALDKFDREKTRRETALNNLESFVIDTQQKLESEEYSSAATPGESEKIAKACSEVSEWLYEDGFHASAETYEEKLTELNSLTSDLHERVLEHRERPEALKGMVSLLNGSRIFLENMRNLNVSNEIFTQIEIETLEKVINDTQVYHETILKVTQETARHEPVPFKVRDIANKMAMLDREVKYLVNKAKIWRPKQEATNSTEETTTEKAKETQEQEAEETVTVEGEETTEQESMKPESKDTEDKSHLEL